MGVNSELEERGTMRILVGAIRGGNERTPRSAESGRVQ